jgi:DNA ligase-4
MLRCGFQDDFEVKMGETEHAMEYDQEHIFKHLYAVSVVKNKCPNVTISLRCFYLDSQENAVKSGLNVKSSKHEKEITKK